MLSLRDLEFFFNDPASTGIYTLSLHDALPISRARPLPLQHLPAARHRWHGAPRHPDADPRSEEHTSELQSLTNLVCRLLLEKKKNLHPTDSTATDSRKPDEPGQETADTN